MGKFNFFVFQTNLTVDRPRLEVGTVNDLLSSMDIYV